MNDPKSPAANPQPPTSFRDAAGRTWNLALNVARLRAVREKTSVDLMELVAPEALGELLADPARLVDVWWVIVEPDALQTGVGDEDFGRSIDGDALEAGVEAFIAGLICFFPKRQREPLAQLWAKVKGLETARAEKALAAIRGGKIDRLIDRELQRADQQLDALLSDSGKPLTGGPGSSASTPGP